MDLSKLIKRKTDEEITKYLQNPQQNIPSIENAIKISKKYNMPMHPKYLFYWNELTIPQLISFLENLKSAKITITDNKIEEINLLPKEKRLLEILGIEHTIKKLPIDQIKKENDSQTISINSQNAKILLTNLGIDILNLSNIKETENCLNNLIEIAKKNITKTPCEILSQNSQIEIRDKGGFYIGTRMGRPEKAKMRKLKGRPHGLFTISEEGGRLRNIIEASKKGYVESEFCIFKNEKGEESIYRIGPDNFIGKEVFFDKYTGKQTNQTNQKAVRYKKIKLDINKYIDQVRKITKTEIPKLVKGIKGTSNKDKVVEHLAKAFLREKNKVYVNKDGTVRFDMIEMGLTHFKPKETGTSIEKLKELGYTKDYQGNELKNEDQIIEILPQDVILPDCTQSGDELASQFIINTANFVDEMLQKLYNLPPFYNFKTKEDTIGHLIIGLAPHTSAGIVGRIIGYSKTQGCFSHPVWHAAQRRNLDGDENGIILLLDALINFSREYLPDRRGSKTMDVPLVLTSHLYLDQIDDEVHGMDIVPYYPLEFYKACKEYKSPKEIKIEKVGKRIDKEQDDEKYLGYSFTHGVDDFNDTILCSSYKSVPSMEEKLDLQLGLAKKIRSVNANKVGSLVIDKHFMKDIKGNLRKFSMQTFRCTKCNEKYRRPPLIGKCTNCGEPSVNFTISEGFIRKYLDPSFKIISEYDIDPYIVETLELAKLRIEGVFGKEEEKQKSLNKFFG